MSPPDPSFLAPLGAAERRPERWLAWIGLTLVFSFVGALGLGLLLGALGGTDLLQSAGTEPLPEGPMRLLDEARLMFLLAAGLAMLAMAVLLAARISFGRGAWTFVSPARPFRLRLLLAGFVTFAVLVAISLIVERLLVGESLDPPVLDPDYATEARLAYLAAGAVFLLLAAAAEEIVFRGVFLQLSGAVTRNLTLIVIVNGLAFSAIHMDPSPGAFTARAISGAVWAWTVLRLGGIEFALGAHFANNLLLTTLVDPFSEGTQVGREIPWPYIAGDVVIMGVTAALVHFALRSERGRVWLAGREPLSLPAASAADRSVSRDRGRP